MSERTMNLKQEISECNLTLHYRRDINVMSVRWQNCSDSIKRRRGYIEALNWAKEIRAYFWILDLRGRGPGQINDDYWVLTEFFRLAGNVLDHTLFTAYLLAPSHFRNVTPRIPVEEVDKFKKIIQVKMFVNEHDALNWLALNQS